jgi:TonB family protein
MLTVLIESALRSLLLGAMVWALLRVLRVRNPHVAGLAWKGVLAGALLMPVVMQWTAMTVPIAGVSWSTIEVLGGAGPASESTSWSTAALVTYLVIAGALSLKYLASFVARWKWARNARPYTGARARDFDVRVSPSVRTPATFGSVVLVPEDFVSWEQTRKQAVLLHEQAHVRNKDFHVQVAAQLHRIVFWFNPLAWWLPKQLSILAEDISDDAAIAALSDRPLYAGMLLEMASRHRDMPATLAMARPATVAQRIERILRERRCPQSLGIRQKIAIGMMLLPLAAVASSASPRVDSAAPVQAAADRTAPGVDPVRGLTRPPYPPESRAAGEEGTLTLSILIGEDGAVRDVKVLQSSGFPRLDQAAAAHAKQQWHFIPGRMNGKPAAVWHEFRVKFSLDDADPGQ